jgi:Planctomycete cytochrome C
MKFLAVFAVLTSGVLIGGSAAADDKAALAVQARDVLKEYCSACHRGKESRGKRFNALIRLTIVQPLEKGGEAMVIPGKPDDSPLWEAIKSGQMPLEASAEAERMAPTQKDVLRKWIEAGAPDWPADQSAPPRTHIDVPKTLAAIRDDLRKAPVDDRPYLRYFTLTHLYNLPREMIKDEDLDLYRAALSKAINSLSWKRRIVVPRPVDTEKTVLAIDLRDLDWDRDQLWKYVLACYPYGLTYENHTDAAYREPYLEIESLSKSELPYVRADWFVATATRPPLYHALLELPDQIDALEAKLGVNLVQNFLNGKLMRAGFARSEISPQANRLVEYHEELYGGYWRSYDFLGGADNSQLSQFPLGPEFQENPFPRQAFRQAGGEIVFNLPNGMQAYLLVNGKGGRIDTAPAQVVTDKHQYSGTAAIVNGLSCMACHNEGMKTGFKDEIRTGARVAGNAEIQVQRLYPLAAAFDSRLEESRKMFLEAQFKAVSPFLKLPSDPLKAFKALPEPISRINQYYRLDRLNAESAAAELGLPNAQMLIAGLQFPSSPLRDLGLGPLADGGNINRADWEKITGTSVFQRAARELRLGTPYRTLVSGFSCEPKTN